MILQTRAFPPDNKAEQFKVIRLQNRVLIQVINNKVYRCWIANLALCKYKKEFTVPGLKIRDGFYSIPEEQFLEITKYNLYLSDKKKCGGKCKQEKPVRAFAYRKSSGSYRLDYTCRKCDHERRILVMKKKGTYNEYKKRRQERRIENLTNGYVKQLLAREAGVKYSDIRYNSLINLKRTILVLKRVISKNQINIS